MAQKEVQHYIDHPVVVFAIKPKTFAYSDSLPEKILDKLEVKLDGMVFILTKSSNAKIYKKVIEIGEKVI